MSCDSEKSTSNKHLGRVDLVVSGNYPAQELFKQGLLYLHSFEYIDARNSFVEAQAADPSCGMAYWGEMMAYNHPLFNREMTKMASFTLNKMGKRKEERVKLFKTEMERDLLESIEILFGDGTKAERDEAYRQHFEKLAKKYPNNHEIKAFHALSILGSPQASKTRSLFEKAAEISKSILDENPDHPGALHYLIHSYDFPTHAHLAVDAADKYAIVAKDATHALHMPSHIYLSLGRWNDVVNSNIDSWNASVEARRRKNGRELGYHSLNWLQYGLLQRDEKELATRLMKDMMYYGQYDKSGLARSYMVAMKGIHMFETDTWNGEIADLVFKTEDLHVTKRTGYNFLDGMKAYKKKDKKLLQEIITKIGKDKYKASLNLGDPSLAMCNTAGNPNIPPNQMDIDLVTIMELELGAHLDRLNGKDDEALTKIEEAVSLYEKLSMTFGPPVLFKPIHEVYAEALMERSQYEKALNAVDKGLETAPGKLQYLKLKKAIAEKTNNNELLLEVNAELEKSLSSEERKEVLKFVVE